MMEEKMQFSNINYNLYKSFLVVYETANISKAAELLFISQPAVSHNIKELEKQLGVQLFYKKANGVSSTSEADILYKYISNGFNSILKGEQSISDMMGLKTGVVKIGIPSKLSVIYLSKIITEFRQIYPNIKIEIYSDKYDDLLEMIELQSIDVLFDDQPIISNKMEVRYLKSYPQCFFTIDKFYQDKIYSIENINNLPLIIPSLSCEEVKLLKNSNPELKINPLIQSGSSETMIKLIKDGNGIGFTQEEYIKTELESGLLKKLNINFPLPKLDIYYAFSKETLANAPKKFIEWIISKN